MRRLAVALTVALALSEARGQSSGESRAAIILTLPSSARGLALGEAWGAIADDESALFYNPAQLSRLRGAQGGGSLQRYIANTNLAAVAVAARVPRGAVALGVQVLDYGSEEELLSGGSQVGVPTGARVSAQDIAITAGYGAAFGSRGEWRVGTALKWVQQHIANVSGSAVATDIGAAWSAANGWEASAALQHIGSRLSIAAVSAALPLTWRVAVATPASHGFLGSTLAIRGLAEARQSSGGLATGVLAGEGVWHAPRPGVALTGRVGVALRGSGDDRQPVTAGGGLTLGRIAIDYAYEGFQLLGATHRVGVRLAAAPPAR